MVNRQPALFRSGTSRLAFAVFTAALLSLAAVWHDRVESAWSSTWTRSAASSGPVISPAAAKNGYWHTRGSEILNEQDQLVRIAGVNWAGFETERFVAGGLTFQDYRTILRFIKNSGYNVIRIPISNQMVESAVVPSQISFSGRTGTINSDLKGLQSLQVLDKIVEKAGELGLKVILDNHRSEAGNSAEANGLWFTAAYPERAWIADWTALAERYRGHATVIGFDLRNEPHGSKGGGSRGVWDSQRVKFDRERRIRISGTVVFGAGGLSENAPGCWMDVLGYQRRGQIRPDGCGVSRVFFATKSGVAGCHHEGSAEDGCDRDAASTRICRDSE